VSAFDGLGKGFSRLDYITVRVEAGQFNANMVFQMEMNGGRNRTMDEVEKVLLPILDWKESAMTYWLHTHNPKG
jgi:hypothetical protein